MSKGPRSLRLKVQILKKKFKPNMNLKIRVIS